MEAVEERITACFEQRKQTAPTNQAATLIERIQALVQRGGKRSRPELLYLAYTGYGGQKPEAIVDLGAALELYHQFLLIHDDVMDKDHARYGGPNVVGMYAEDGSDVAESMGILAGDLLFTYVNQLILAMATIDQSHRHELLAILHEVNADEMFGQQLDIYNLPEKIAEFSEEHIVLIHALKTARYTTQLPFLMAAAILDLDHEERTKLSEFGRAFGIAYQLADDYSDYFEDSAAFKDHKHRFRDYRQAKITHPIYLGLTRGSEEQVKTLRRNLGNKKADDVVAKEVLSILDESGAKGESRAFALRYHDEAKKLLDTLNLNEVSRQSVEQLLQKFRV